jgi:hypothetical protein
MRNQYSSKLNINEIPFNQDKIYESKFGYVLIRNFINQDLIDEVLNKCTSITYQKSVRSFYGKGGFYRGCPNYISHKGNADSTVFHNLPWNVPVSEELHHQITEAHMYRNKLMNMPSTFELLGNDKRVLNYRLAITRGGDTIVKPHRDFINPYEPHRLQCTIFLSKYGIDYSGEGFIFFTNAGERIVPAKELDIEPGDLMFWKYTNMHEVANVKSTTHSHIGFARILMSTEIVKAKSFINKIKEIY